MNGGDPGWGLCSARPGEWRLGAWEVRAAGKGKGGEMARGSGGTRLAPWKRGFPRPAAGGRRDVPGAGG